MDDDQTRDTLDFLGDLYLTGAKAGQGDHGDSLADQLDGPQPLRFAPNTVSSRPMSGNHAHTDARRPRPHRAAAKPSRVEAVFLGNLPGFGGPWLTQYAHALAEAVGPVVVMHVDDEQVDLELIGTTAQRTQIEQLAHAGDVPVSQGLIAALMAMTRPRLPAVGAYLVHLPLPVSETTSRLAPRIARWTMICSADQMAVVSAYRSIKELVAADDGNTDRGIGLMVMGADESSARQASGRLEQTAGEFLDQPIDLVGWRRQMVPVRIKTLGSFEAGVTLWPRIEAFLDEQGGEAELVTLPLRQHTQDMQELPQPAPTPVVAAAPTDEERAALRDALEDDEDDAPIDRTTFVDPPTQEQRQAVREAMTQPGVDSPTSQPDNAATPDSVRQFVSRLQHGRAVESMEHEQVVIRGDSTDGARPTRPQPPSRTPADDTAASPPQPDAPMDHAPFAEPLQLVRFVARQLQAMAMDARSPQYPNVQIAVDRDSRAHLLVHHEVSEGSLNDMMMQLIQSRHWVRQHAALLRMTQPQLRIDAHAEPMLHLFTADAKAAAALVGHVDDTIKLHLLQQIHVGDSATWFATELN